MATLILDELLSISLQDLKRVGVFPRKDGLKRGIIKISRRSAIQEIEGVVDVIVFLSEENSYLQLDYCLDGNAVKQRFELIKSVTIEPKSYKWMLVCPITGFKGLKLYFCSQRFNIRLGLKKSRYLVQTVKFGNKRNFLNSVLKDQRLNKRIKIAHQLHFKPFYKGMVTKKNKRVIEAKNELNRLIL